jgi:hypothetical protein
MEAGGWMGLMALAVMLSTASLATAIIWVTTTNPLWLVDTAGRLLAMVW